MKKVKILVAYHTKDKLYKNSVLLPIHCGRALMAPDDENRGWYLNNLMGDDTGDNISALNKEFCELTALYWAWKNYDRMGGADYIGLAHYRRLWYLADDFTPMDGSLLDKIALSEENLASLVEKYPVVMTRCYEDKTLTFREFQKYIRLSEKKHPIFYKGYCDFEKYHRYYFCNMFIFPKEIFFDYCENIFSILFASKEYVERTGQTVFPRFYGFAAEYLTSFYQMNLVRDNRLAVKEMPVVYLDPPKAIKM